MWKVERVSGVKGVTLRLCGRIQTEELTDLSKVFAAERSSQAVVLDLEELKLVDQGAVTFLARCEASGTELSNCPAYIREWITREESRDQLDDQGI